MNFSEQNKSIDVQPGFLVQIKRAESHHKAKNPHGKSIAEKKIYVSAKDHEIKDLNFIFPTTYVDPKSLKVSHWLSRSRMASHSPLCHGDVPDFI